MWVSVGAQLLALGYCCCRPLRRHKQRRYSRVTWLRLRLSIERRGSGWCIRVDGRSDSAHFFEHELDLCLGQHGHRRTHEQIRQRHPLGLVLVGIFPPSATALEPRDPGHLRPGIA
nr:MAG TPA: hypothetical protein [Caudoviricetes sp.]